ncbi:MAG: rod shape-determining protein RodA [Chitinivibrionales bacterium]|nr:rod shape-determining protein RodA [Chitinivibrionales bacterium]MBD3396496.1 rod shape-determining protein RodA [Chitinivibrionales bacterium]
MLEIGRKNRFDFSLFFAALALWIIGLALIYSATHIHESGPLAGVARTQAIWIAMGVLIILAMVSIPTRIYYALAYPMYALSLLLLLYVIFSGVGIKGAARWISFGGVKVQPSEFAKVGLLFALARYLSKHSVSLTRITSFIVPGLLILVPFALVLQQPDLGTALVFCAMALPMFYWAGMSLLEVFFLISPGISIVLSAIPLILAYGQAETLGVVGAIPWGLFFLILIAVFYVVRPPIFVIIGALIANVLSATMTTVLWNSFLKDYQKKRIISFIDPQMDPFGSGYQVIQSKVAIGSGHVFGKGYLQGTQTRLSYLPEQHTDFIFSVLGEQFGLLGCALVVFLFLFLLMRGFLATQHIRNRFTNLIIVGSVSILAFHIFVNIAMTLGMMPVTGLPLPFLSYGGSFTLTVAVFVGLLLNAQVGDQEF